MSEARINKPESLDLTASPRESNRYTTSAWLVGIGVILGGAILFAAFNLFRIVQDKNDTAVQKTSSSSQVCTSSDIAKYNSAVAISSDEDAARSRQTLETLVKSIKLRENNAKDPTCQYILWQQAYSINDKQAQKTYLQALTELRDNGSYVSGEVKGLRSVENIKSLTNEQQTDPEKRGEG
jgi:hypothetical protein